ncbi:MAG: L-aspartate oxidase [bacterium]|nr:L-aspartate oxidase [bacterium]MBU1918765.1 L-aspartate oxidase [bacterium]
MNTDILIVGSGIAGLSLALKVADHYHVTILTKKEAIESNTRYAQGGIASVMARKDNFDTHIKDTIRAGSNLNDAKAVENVVCAGPTLINELLNIGVRFSRFTKSEFDLGKEGGHSKRRVLHAKDLTGFEIVQNLLIHVKKHANITLLENHAAIDLICNRHLKKRRKNNLCYGAYVLNKLSGKIVAIKARATVLATGGAGKTYLYTSNPDIASGDGIAMAHRAGCQIANLEFVQFHPTCLHHPKAKSFLISEAMRGEGGKLELVTGKRFMSAYHKNAELAPRDIVARAIDLELKKRGDEYVTLNMTHHSRDFLKKRFPNIYQTCRSFNYDIAKKPIPVVPAAHYFCGGVKVDYQGRTNIANLYAIGEVSCTGVHGANRLASNSLLEGLAYANFAYTDIIKRKDLEKNKNLVVRSWDSGRATNSDEAVVISQNWDEVRRLMWNYVGIARSNKRLYRAQTRINILKEEIKEYYWNFILTPDLLELRNICCVADLTIKSALKRKESIGLHYNIDYPQQCKKSSQFNIIPKA